MRRSSSHKNLIRRYLLWAYKSTKESFERIERKTTQLMADEFILDYFSKHRLDLPEEFRQYVAAKRQDETKLKFSDGKRSRYHPQYLYLKNRLAAIEAAVEHFLGKAELGRFEKLFEGEFTRRILEARDH